MFHLHLHRTMFHLHLHRTALSAGLVTTLALAVSAAPAALAQRSDLRSPDARDAAAAIRIAPALRNPDARQADAGGRIVAAGPPTWPLTPQPLNPPHNAASAPPRPGLDWSSAGIGAAALVAALALALVGIGGVRSVSPGHDR
jgi:hypothetical protein